MTKRNCVHCGREIDVSYLEERKVPNFENVKLCSECMSKCRRSKIYYHSFEERFVIEENISAKQRVVVILLNSVVKKKQGNKEKEYREVVGLDVTTGGIVKIVDENGKKYSLHTGTGLVAKLEVEDVIKAPFKSIDCASDVNTWRISGEYKLLGKTKLYQLRNKYRGTYWFDICAEFNDIIKLPAQTNNTINSFYCLARFSNTQIKNNCIKMRGKDVRLDESAKNLTTKENSRFQGMALLYVSIKPNGTTYVAKYLYSDCREDSLENNSHKNVSDTTIAHNKNKWHETINDDPQKLEETYMERMIYHENNMTAEEVERYKKKWEDMMKQMRSSKSDNRPIYDLLYQPIQKEEWTI